MNNLFSSPEQKARMRVSKACDRCRSQKIKCSGTYPCATCVKHKRGCVYNSNPMGKAELSGGFNSSAPTILNTQNEKELPYVLKTEDKSYITHLENRIQYLESRLSSEGNSVALELRNGEVDNEETTRFINPSSKWRYSNRNQILLVQELCTTIYETLTPENRQKVVLPRYQYFGWNLSGTHYLSADPLPEPPDFKLPQPIEFYTDYFFREINQLFAIIHEPVFKLQLSTYQEQMKKHDFKPEPEYDQQDAGNLHGGKRGGHTSSKGQAKLFEAMLYLIIALSIRFTEFQKKKSLSMKLLEIEEEMFKYSYKIVDGLSFQWESFELIQCWLLITLYLRVTHRQTSYFTSLGNAVIMAKSMGISRKRSGHRLPGTAYEELKARRIFWSLFIFERTLGLQSGRYNLINEKEVEIPFPSMDFRPEDVKDSWMTLSSLAMLHIARLSTFVHTANFEKLDIVKYQQINKDLIQLNQWLNDNGFNNNEIFNNPKEKISSMVKCQVKLHFYDLILSAHGKVLFNFVGRRIATAGLKIEMVLDSSINIVDILCKLHKANLLYVPWYMNLLLLFNASVNFLVLINSGLYSGVARENYAKTIQLMNVLKKANVKSDDNKVIIKKRFKMAEECVWAVKNAARAMSLRFEQDLDNLNLVGGDPGPSDVNQATFSQYGYSKDKDDEFNDLLRTGKRRKLGEKAGLPPGPPGQLQSSQSSQKSQGDYIDSPVQFPPPQPPQPPQAAHTTQAAQGPLLNQYNMQFPGQVSQIPNIPVTPEFQRQMNNLNVPVGQFPQTSSSSDYSETNEVNPNDPSYFNKDNVFADQLSWFDQWDDQLLDAFMVEGEPRA